jgi:uncharacterized membrane protein YphA (DoxX/SURF4 family)
MPDRRLLRISIASVWFYQGFWCKVCAGSQAHFSVISSVPFIGSGSGRSALVALGLGECCIAAWVLSGRRMRLASIVQTVLLIAMNTGGLMWAWRVIPDPVGMILLNFAFLLLIWVAADKPQEAVHA